MILAKAVEASATSKRIEIEEQIAAQIPTKEEGSKTVTVDGFKITVKRGLNYKADLEAIEAVCVALSIHVPIKTSSKRELDTKGYKWFREHDPAVFGRIAEHVTVTPKKVAVELKPVAK